MLARGRAHEFIVRVLEGAAVDDGAFTKDLDKRTDVYCMREAMHMDMAGQQLTRALAERLAQIKQDFEEGRPTKAHLSFL